MGPSWPQPVIRPKTSFGLRARHDLGSEPQPFGHPGTESLHEPVGLFDQPEDQGHPVGMLEVHGHRTAAPVHQVDVGLGVGRVGGPLRTGRCG